MNEHDFWGIIDKIDNKDSQSLVTELMKLAPEDIISFGLQLKNQLVKLYKPDIEMITFIIMSDVADDIFEDFRTWLICQGKDKYSIVSQNADNVAELLDSTDIDNIDGEWYLSPLNAYTKLTGADEDTYFDLLYCNNDIVSDPDINVEWPDKLEDLENIFPKTFRKFWNPSKIKALHPRGYYG